MSGVGHVGWGTGRGTGQRQRTGGRGVDYERGTPVALVGMGPITTIPSLLARPLAALTHLEPLTPEPLSPRTPNPKPQTPS